MFTLAQAVHLKKLLFGEGSTGADPTSSLQSLPTCPYYQFPGASADQIRATECFLQMNGAYYYQSHAEQRQTA